MPSVRQSHVVQEWKNSHHDVEAGRYELCRVEEDRFKYLFENREEYKDPDTSCRKRDDTTYQRSHVHSKKR